MEWVAFSPGRVGMSLCLKGDFFSDVPWGLVRTHSLIWGQSLSLKFDITSIPFYKTLQKAWLIVTCCTQEPNRL